jgi:hypothetical protein
VERDSWSGVRGVCTPLRLRAPSQQGLQFSSSPPPPPSSPPPARMLQGCYKGVTRVLQGSYKEVTRISQECYKDVTRTSRGCHKTVEISCAALFANFTVAFLVTITVRSKKHIKMFLFEYYEGVMRVLCKAVLRENRKWAMLAILNSFS